MLTSYFDSTTFSLMTCDPNDSLWPANSFQPFLPVFDIILTAMLEVKMAPHLSSFFICCFCHYISTCHGRYRSTEKLSCARHILSDITLYIICYVTTEVLIMLLYLCDLCFLFFFTIRSRNMVPIAVTGVQSVSFLFVGWNLG